MTSHEAQNMAEDIETAALAKHPTADSATAYEDRPGLWQVSVFEDGESERVYAATFDGDEIRLESRS